MSLNLIGGMAGCCKCFGMRDEAAIRNREVCGPRARRRWFGKVADGQDHASEISNPLVSATGGDQDWNRLSSSSRARFDECHDYVRYRTNLWTLIH